MAEEWTGGRAFDDPEGYHAWLLTMDADDPEVQRVDREIDAICRAVLTDLLPAGYVPAKVPLSDEDEDAA